MKRWQILSQLEHTTPEIAVEDLIAVLLKNRGLTTKEEIENFLVPPYPDTLTPRDVSIDESQLAKAIARILTARKKGESVVVYADYDADGITAGAIMWETLHTLGVKIMPYIPHRVEEGYGFSRLGIDKAKKQYNPSLIISVDHGITAYEKIEYAKSLGIDVIVTDHHTKPEKVPDCITVHTTELCGAGISWFLVKELLKAKGVSGTDKVEETELLALAAIGTIADMVPLTGPRRAIAKYGLEAINHTQRLGLEALIASAGLEIGKLGTYEISHMLAPRLNAMGRLVHALDALRLLCTKQPEKAEQLAEQLGLTNKERQQMTEEFSLHARETIELRIKNNGVRKLLFIAHETYNQGVIGLVAGRLVENYYRPAIVIAKGKEHSKASARSVSGFNIIEAIRSCADLLVDAGGHPMAAGFTVETAKLELLQTRLEALADASLTEETLTRILKIDTVLDAHSITFELFSAIAKFAPFGVGNPEPVFVTKNLLPIDIRLVGREGRHLKLRLRPPMHRLLTLEGIAFGMGEWYGKLSPMKPINVAYTLDRNVWNGHESLQLKIKDIQEATL